jgi:hypothetical protein
LLLEPAGPQQRLLQPATYIGARRSCRRPLHPKLERLIPQGSHPEFSAECAAVTDAPETRYARSADGTNLAYQVSGDGSRRGVLQLGTPDRFSER